MNRDLLLQLRNAIDIAIEATDENALRHPGQDRVS